MKTEDIIKRLKNPEQYRTSGTTSPAQNAPQEAAQPVAAQPTHKTSWLELGVGAAVGVLFVVTLLFWVMSKNRAENLTAALDPDHVQGLSLADKEFNPNTEVTYVEVREGHDRNVAVSNLGSTLPIISRFNFKTLTDKNYEVIGAAPWALTTNFESNLADPELVRYLLSNDKMIQAFLARPDVAPLLEDPHLLLAFTEDSAALQDFFNDATVRAVLADQKMVRTVAGSRFMSHLLISKAVKYYRDRPQEALNIIRSNPVLEAVRQNPNVQIAVRENPYLKTIADTLLAKPAPSRAAPVAQGVPGKTPAAKRTARNSKKK